MTVDVDFPYHLDGRGRTAGTDPDDHLRDLIEQVLFTAPGERVMRPDFGSGLLGLVFEPGGPELVATTQHLVQGALQRELGHLIAVESVEVSQDDGALFVTIQYVALRTQERRSARFSRSVS
jgi:phage baseplate assembly protein W